MWIDILIGGAAVLCVVLVIARQVRQRKKQKGCGSCCGCGGCRGCPQYVKSQNKAEDGKNALGQ